MKNIFRGMALLFLPFGGLVPSGVALLWVSNSFFSVLVSVQDQVDNSPASTHSHHLTRVNLST